MSNRRKDKEPKPEFTMSVAPTFFVNQYQFRFDGNMVIMDFGRSNQTHASVAMSAGLVHDMASKLVSQILPAPPQAEEPKSEK